MKIELFLIFWHTIYSSHVKNYCIFSKLLISYFLISNFFSDRFLRSSLDSSFFDSEMYKINDMSTSKLAFPFWPAGSCFLFKILSPVIQNNNNLKDLIKWSIYWHNLYKETHSVLIDSTNPLNGILNPSLQTIL